MSWWLPLINILLWWGDINRIEVDGIKILTNWFYQKPISCTLECNLPFINMMSLEACIIFLEEILWLSSNASVDNLIRRENKWSTLWFSAWFFEGTFTIGYCTNLFWIVWKLFLAFAPNDAWTKSNPFIGSVSCDLNFIQREERYLNR